MLFLKTFGGLSVDAGSALGAGAGQRRKTLALLALLAAAGNHGMSRDKLIAFLWPDTDLERGRNLLKQACFTLRQDLHAPEVFLGAHELRLNPDAIDSDIQRFGGPRPWRTGCAIRDSYGKNSALNPRPTSSC